MVIKGCEEQMGYLANMDFSDARGWARLGHGSIASCRGLRGFGRCAGAILVMVDPSFDQSTTGFLQCCCAKQFRRVKTTTRFGGMAVIANTRLNDD